MGYSKRVFINCPFDGGYRSFFEILLFIFQYYELEVCYSETMSSAHDRLDQITDLIDSSRLSIHDLSRNKAEKRGEFARFNMPFELGIDYGCFKFKKGRHDKVIAILDGGSHDYDQYISDLSGRDILNHNNDPDQLFQIIPEWLSRSLGIDVDGPRILTGIFAEWKRDYKNTLKERGYDLRTANKVSKSIYHRLLKNWLKDWKKNTVY